MPLPDSLQPHTEDPEFWAALLGPAAVAPEVRISLPVAGGYGLILDLAGGEQALGLREPHTHEPVQLGWAAPDRPHPAALRFADLEICGRVIALDDPTLPHPGLPVALLSGFAPTDDPLALITLEAAYRSLRRDAPPTTGPEQTPLPLFADARWWPQPASDRVLGEGDIAAYLTPRSARPRHLPDLVRHAKKRLSRLPQEPWANAAFPAARDLVASGDLGIAPSVLSALETAGCDHPTVLDAFSQPLVPAEACWVAETLTDAAPGTALRHWLQAPSIAHRPLG